MKSNRISMAVSAACLALLAGCANVSKDFVEPPSAAPAAFRHADPAAVDSARLPAAWWTIYNDATLNALEQRAVTGSPSVRASGQRLMQAQAQLNALRSSQLPSVNAGAGASNSRTSARTSQGLALGGRSIEGNNYSVGASLSWELDLWGRVRRVIEAADGQALAAQDERDGVILLLSAQVAQTYWQLRGLDAEIAILNGALGARREAEQVVEARFKGGLTNELDLSRARIERANAESDLHEAARQRDALEHALATLVGASPSTPLVAANAGTELPAPPAIPVGLPASLLAQRPDLAASVANLRSAHAQVGAAEASFYPSVSLTGNFGFASEALHDITSGAARQFSLGPLAVTLPVFDAGRNRANLALAQARYQEALATHQGRLLTALREVEDALSDVHQRRLQGETQAQSQQAATRALLVARARYERGLSNYLDVTDAQRSALAADRAAVQIRTQRLLASAAVARALGGGWKQDAPAIAQAPAQQ
ncbi:MAG: efflux transporter outer membrane subunit [Gammaproteobacteria bacterium]